ncbi:MAG: hypothetical protein FJX34_03085 [Alphaproteobacteria bacterium]|nr:hypothetical protein [Alphaproteobacteria bacterium]
MKFILIFLAIFLAIFCTILVMRATFIFALNQATKQLRKNSPKARKKYEKEEEELRRKREIPRAHSEVKAEKKEQAKKW